MSGFSSIYVIRFIIDGKTIFYNKSRDFYNNQKLLPYIFQNEDKAKKIILHFRKLYQYWIDNQTHTNQLAYNPGYLDDSIKIYTSRLHHWMVAEIVKFNLIEHSSKAVP